MSLPAPRLISRADGGYFSGNTPVTANIPLAMSESVPPVILVQPTNQVVTGTGSSVATSAP